MHFAEIVSNPASSSPDIRFELSELVGICTLCFY